MNKCTQKQMDECDCEMGCEGCYYNKPIANTDVTYCINDKCETKDDCFRYYGHYEFDEAANYSFINKCNEFQG